MFIFIIGVITGIITGLFTLGVCSASSRADLELEIMMLKAELNKGV